MAELSFYSTTADGFVYNDDADWATCRGATTGDLASSGDDRPYVEAADNGATYRITRSFIAFDTSSIPDDATISAATLRVNWTAGSWADTGSGASKALVAATHADTLTTDDFDAVGSTRLADTDIPYNSDGVQIFTLNATGIAQISLTGTTKMAFRLGFDLDNVTPTGYNSVRFDARELGTDWCPKLTVTYTTPTTTSTTTTSSTSTTTTSSSSSTTTTSSSTSTTSSSSSTYTTTTTSSSSSTSTSTTIAPDTTTSTTSSSSSTSTTTTTSSSSSTSTTTTLVEFSLEEMSFAIKEEPIVVGDVSYI